MNKRYAVGIEICHVLTEAEAKKLADKIRNRLGDMDEDIYICITEYEQVGFRKTSWELDDDHDIRVA